MRDFIKKIIRFSLSPFILGEYFIFKKQNDERFSMKFSDIYPCIKDRTTKTRFDRHYVYHTAWAARVVKEINPEFHIDVSSILYFSGIVSAFIPVHFYDYRPAALSLSNLESEKGDLHHLPFEDSSVHSISCMHTLEHVGLGRYGDPIDAKGDIKAINELKRVVSAGGNLIIVVPVGKPRIEFNAHRVYSYEQIMEYVMDEKFSLKEFAFIPEHEHEGPIERNADPSRVANSHYACGCFWFQKK